MDTITQWQDDDLTFMEKYPNGIPLVEMIPFYEAVAKNEPVKLEWTCPGKRDPKSEEKTEPSVATSVPNTSKSDSVESQSAAAKLAEFDFDEGSSQPFFSPVGGGVTQPLRRVVGTSRHPPRQPRVANMDKILNDLFRTRKETPTPVCEPSQQTSVTSGSILDGDNKPTSVGVSLNAPAGPSPVNNRVAEGDVNSLGTTSESVSAETNRESKMEVTTLPPDIPKDTHVLPPEKQPETIESIVPNVPFNVTSSESLPVELPTQLAHTQISE